MENFVFGEMVHYICLESLIKIKNQEPGNGIEQNFEEAFIWLSIGANNGHPECQCNLASMYLDGDGVPEF